MLDQIWAETKATSKVEKMAERKVERKDIPMGKKMD